MRQADPDVIEHQILGRVASVVRGQREISKVSERPLWNRGVGAALSRFEPMASLASRLIDEKMAWKKRRATGRPVTKQVNSRTKPQAETP